MMCAGQFHRIFISGQVTLDDNFNKEFAFSTVQYLVKLL